MYWSEVYLFTYSNWINNININVVYHIIDQSTSILPTIFHYRQCSPLILYFHSIVSFYSHWNLGRIPTILSNPFELSTIELQFKQNIRPTSSHTPLLQEHTTYLIELNHIITASFKAHHCFCLALENFTYIYS